MKAHILKYPSLVCLLLFLISACSVPAEQPAIPTSTPAATTKPTASEATPVPTASVCESTTGQFAFFEMPSEVMNYPMEGRIYLPPCYGFDPEKTYPVLYFLHGQSFKDDQWDRLGAVSYTHLRAHET